MKLRRLIGIGTVSAVMAGGTLVAPAPAGAAGHTVTFPSPASTAVDSGLDGAMGDFFCCLWSASRGDRVAETVTTELSTVEAATLTFDVPFNYLSRGRSVVLELTLDGVAVASHTVPSGFTGTVVMSTGGLSLPGGELHAALRVANEVPSGGGGIGIGDHGSLNLEGPSVVPVPLDVLPGSTDNPLNLRSGGVVPVAVLSTADLDAATLDPATACFGDAEAPDERDCSAAQGVEMTDVDADGRVDLVLHFHRREIGVDPGDTDACLTATTFTGTDVAGCDAVRVR